MRFILVAISLLVASPAWACGAFITETADSTISMDAQRAVYHVNDDRLVVTVQVTGEDPSPKFSWVVPVPADDSIALSVTSSALFNELDAITKPDVSVSTSNYDSDSGGGCGCGGFEDGGAVAGDLRDNSVDVFDAGIVGDYEYVIVGGDAAESITDWLQTNGYSVQGEISTELQTYVDAGMRFVAVKFTNDAINGQEFGGQPLVIDMAKPATLMYPLGLSRLSVSESIPVLIFVIADARYQSSFENMALGEIATKMRATYDRTGAVPGYAQVVDEATVDAGGKLFVTDYAQSFSGCSVSARCPALEEIAVGKTITRMYANVPAGSLDDVSFATGPTEDVENVQYASVERVGDVAWALAPFVLLMAWPLRRRFF